jgi:Uma2 family endonuclease
VSRAEEEKPVTAALQPHLIGPNTIEDWLAMDPPEDGSRLELIWGHLHVSPAPMGQHQVAVFQLSIVINDVLRRAGRTDLHVVPGIAVEISTPMRTGLIPDIVVLDTPPIGASFQAENVMMAVEVWSGGNTRSERDSKIAAYAIAGITHFWAVSQGRLGGFSVAAYGLEHGKYVAELTAQPGETVTIKAAPEPVTFDPAVLSP